MRQRNQRSFPLLPSGAEPAPCFYASTGNGPAERVTALGRTRWFRSRYRKSEGATVPEVVQPREAPWDLARSLFGQVSKAVEGWAGRVFVEDAWLVGAVAAALLPPRRRQILARPKLTTVERYLVQPGTGGAATLRHWEWPDALPRGFKQYWRRPGAPWVAPDTQPSAGSTEADGGPERDDEPPRQD